MKKRLICFTLLFVLIISTIPVSAATIKLSYSELELEVGESQKIKLKGASGKITWSSTKPEIAKVKASGSNGAKITGVSEGQSTITAIYKKKIYKCVVSVSAESIECTIKCCDWNDDGTVDKFEKTGLYSGPLKNGKPHGKGTFTSVNSSGVMFTYTGEFKNGMYNGKGVLAWEDGTDLSGTWTDGLFTPTFGEIVAWYGDYTLSSDAFSLDDEKTIEAIDSLNSLSKSKLKSKAKSIDYKKLNKSIKSYIGKVDYISKCYVFQVSEYLGENGHNFTKIAAQDMNENIYLFFYDSTIDVYEGDYIEVYGTPFGNISWKNVSGGTTKAIGECAYIIKKV